MWTILFPCVFITTGLAAASAGGPIEAAQATPVGVSAPGEICGNPVSRVMLSNRPGLCPKPLGLTLIAPGKRIQRA